MSGQPIPASGGLREQRCAAGLTQQALAERAGCSLSYVRLLEAGFEPRRSRVVAQVISVLNAQDPGYHPGALQKDGDAAPPTGPE